MPLTLSPTGGTRLFHPDGETAAARAHSRRHPVRAGASEHHHHGAVSGAAPGLRRWFNWSQLGTRSAPSRPGQGLHRGLRRLMVNVDCRAIGHRERDYRNGFTAPPSIKPKTVVEGMLHPDGPLGSSPTTRSPSPTWTHEIPEGPLSSTPDMWRTLLAGTYEPTDWDDILDLRERWSGPIDLKGVVSPNDAALAAAMGIDAIQVSNHGGRQLDHMASPLDLLPELSSGRGSP